MEIANEVLDDGLANDPMDPSLLELKEMMDQMLQCMEHLTGVREKQSNTSNKMSRFGRDSNAIVPTFSQLEPLNVFLGSFHYGMPKSHTMLPKVFHFPYVVREVLLIYGITPHENRAANFLFSTRLKET
ncbi:hypothetical protein Tco_0307809 [Tanacetum coccineum]